MTLDRDGLLFKAVDHASRGLGNIFFGDKRRLSTHLGNVVVSQNASWYHLLSAGLVDLITMEKGHCFRNAGKL